MRGALLVTQAVRFGAVACLCLGFALTFAAMPASAQESSTGEAPVAEPTEAEAGTIDAVTEEAIEEPEHAVPEMLRWSFAGFFGKYDTAQLQRGFQVYREVCAACHSLDYIAFRNLGDSGGPHFSEAEVRSVAAEYQITAGPNEFGDMFDRPGIPADYFPAPFPNPQAAAAANGAVPPDLSLMAKARGIERGIVWTVLDFFTQYQEAGPDYIHALLTGFETTPPCAEGAAGYYNIYFVGGGIPEACKTAEGASTIVGSMIAMPPPLSDGLVTYSDGSPETVDQYARDLSAFLMWTAEPSLDQRKRLGFQVFVFLIVFAGLMYFTKRRVWSDVAH